MIQKAEGGSQENEAINLLLPFPQPRGCESAQTRADRGYYRFRRQQSFDLVQLPGQGQVREVGLIQVWGEEGNLKLGKSFRQVLGFARSGTGSKPM